MSSAGGSGALPSAEFGPFFKSTRMSGSVLTFSEFGEKRNLENTPKNYPYLTKLDTMLRQLVPQIPH